MSSSTDLAGARVMPLATPELRTGEWTRLGPSGLLGDAVTERTLAGVAEEARAAASAQGYAVGWAQGRREAAEAAEAERRREAERVAADDAARDQEHRAAVAALLAAAADLRAGVAATTARVEEQASDLALALAAQIVGHEVRSVTSADVVRRVLDVLPDAGADARTAAVVRLHPAHAESARAALAAAEPALPVRVVGDAALGPADALVETDLAAVDLRIDAALERVRGVLR